jgi:hypothetical protein
MLGVIKPLSYLSHNLLHMSQQRHCAQLLATCKLLGATRSLACEHIDVLKEGLALRSQQLFHVEEQETGG